MKATVEKILTGIDKEIGELLSSTVSDGRRMTVSSDESLDNAMRMQQLKNAHIMICNAFDEESIHEKEIRFYLSRKKKK